MYKQLYLIKKDHLFLQYPFHLMLHKRPLFAFKDNTPCLQRLQLMPHILRDVNPIVATLLTQHHIFYDRAIIIVSSHSNLASQDNERLSLRWVPMNRQRATSLDRIQHPLGAIYRLRRERSPATQLEPTSNTLRATTIAVTTPPRPLTLQLYGPSF